MASINLKKFEGVTVNSKIAICGLPIRVDSYKTCEFGCTYCFANNRVICQTSKTLQVANLDSVERRLDRVLIKGEYKEDALLDTLIAQGITWHCGGMSDPFQRCEGQYHITRDMIDICNKYNVSILFSTKSDNLYEANIRPDLHAFQMSITNIKNRKDLEPNVPDISERYKLYRELKDNGFKVGIRIQPFIPDAATLEIVKMFEDADNFTLEGLKLVPQNKEHIDQVLQLTGLKREQFTLMGLLNLKPEIREKMYEPFIKYLNEKNIPFSIADNDMHDVGTNSCCCGDRLINKGTNFNTTAMCQKYGCHYSKEQIDHELEVSGIKDCKCKQIFPSNRQKDGTSVQDFYDSRFERKGSPSPFGPKYLYSRKKEKIKQ